MAHSLLIKSCFESSFHRPTSLPGTGGFTGIIPKSPQFYSWSKEVETEAGNAFY